MISATAATSRQAVRQNITIDGVLDRQQPGPAGRHGQQPAQRAEGGLARDRVARDDGHRQRQHETVSMNVEDHEREEHAVPGEGVEERRTAAAARAAAAAS